MTRTTLTFALLAAAALGGCEAMPQAAATAPAPLPAKERFVAAVEAQGCVLTNANVGAVLLRAGLVQAEVEPIVAQLNVEGRAQVDGPGAIRVISPACPAPTTA